tara:strand:+ start:1348 stop:2265 length:918 start_codon:yes stop_codon:yes gene_type:complete
MTSDQPSLLVLAAGMGSRYGGLKQLDPVGPSGETLMDYSIYDAKRAGFTRVVFLIRREMRDLFEEQVGRKYQGILEVDYAYQEKDDLPGDFACPPERQKPWGTGHAVWAAREALQGSSFAVINADDFYGAETFTELMKAFSSEPSAEGMLECAMVGFRLSETLSEHGSVSRGICQTENGYLQSVEEWTEISGADQVSGKNPAGDVMPLTGEETTSMNVWAFPPDAFSPLGEGFSRFLESMPDPTKSEFYLPAAVDEWIRQGTGRVSVRSASCSWMGVTYKEDKPRVQKAIARLVDEGIYPSPLLG